MTERMRIKLHKGLDLKVPGAPRQAIAETREPGAVALLGHDHPRLHCELRVAAGDRVRLGDTLFVDRRRPEIRFTSPAAGRVKLAQSEEGRQLALVVVERDDVVDGDPGVDFAQGVAGEAAGLDRDAVRGRLLASGQWPALRMRPGGGIPDPESVPDAIFVRTMDSNPLAPSPAVVLADRRTDFEQGLVALTRLTDGPVFVCCDGDIELDARHLDRVHVVAFEGPHPAGLVGTHIHHLFPVRDARRVGYIGYQETLAIGHLFRTGYVDPQRIVSVAGPMVREPRLLRTRLGACTEDLVRGELLAGDCRVVSGSLLSGRRAATSESYLGRYHDQISVLSEGREESRGARPIPTRWGTRWVPFWRRGKNWTTALHGPARAMLPLPFFDHVMPLDVPIALLLRALAAGDFDAARAFGALELEEEDLALCTYLCPSKLEYGALLRAVFDSDRTGAE